MVGLHFQSSMMSMDNLLLVLPAVSLLGAFVSTVTGMGGGLIILATCTLVLPLTAAVPVSGVLVMAGQAARTIQFHREINRSIARPFIPGAIIGATIGSFIYFSMPELLIAFMLATVMLWFCWVPAGDTGRRLAQKIPWPYFWVGIVHTFLSTIAGVGGLFQSLMVNSSMNKMQIVATIAGTLLFMSLFKTLAYISAGFSFMPYLWVIVLCWIAGYLGTWLGRHSLHRISDRVFRHLIRIMVTLFAFRLYWSVAAELWL